MVTPMEETTVQNYDMQFGTNVIGGSRLFLSFAFLTYDPISCRFTGHWLFTILLLPALFAATDASPTHEKARIVTVSSSTNYLTNVLDFDAFADGPQRKKYSPWDLYSKSKLVCGVFFFIVYFLTSGGVMWW
jgi:retinol dehydrogenase 12